MYTCTEGDEGNEMVEECKMHIRDAEGDEIMRVCPSVCSKISSYVELLRCMGSMTGLLFMMIVYKYRSAFDHGSGLRATSALVATCCLKPTTYVTELN